MVHLDLDLTGECQLKCFYCDRTPDRFNEIPARKELNAEERKAVIRQARLLGATTVEFPGGRGTDDRSRILGDCRIHS